MKSLLRLAMAAFTVYALFLMIGCALQRSLIFYPSNASSAVLDGLAADLEFERWTTPSGRSIGWQSRSGNPQKPVLILHGNAGFALHRAALVRHLRMASPDLNAKYYVLEYPGYGDRRGSPSERTLVEAAQEGIALLARDTPPIVVGESIGTGVASLAAAADPESVAALILITPFDSLTAVAKYHYPWLPVRWILTERFNSAKNLPNFPGPVAFLVAGADEITPTKIGLRLYDSYPGIKRLWVAEGAGHNEAIAQLPANAWTDLMDFAATDK